VKIEKGQGAVFNDIDAKIFERNFRYPELAQRNGTFKPE